MVRFPDGMRDRIAAAAKANGRSMNSEIIAALEVMFPQGMKSSGADIDEVLLQASRLVQIAKRMSAAAKNMP